MRSGRNILGWATALVLWLGLLPLVWAQVESTPAAPRAIPAQPASVLSGENRSYTLDRRARYFIDDTGTRTVESLEAAGDSIPWSLREPGASYRIDGKALWFQFDAINTGGSWFVELGSSGIDRAQFFWRGNDGRWIGQESGDTLAVPDWPLPGRLPTFPLASKGDQPVRYWIRIEHSRVDYASPLLIYDQSALMASREREQFLLGGYFSLAALIAIVAAANAIVYRDRNFGAYVVYVTTLAAGQLAYLGVGAQHVWAEWLHWNSISTFVLPGLSAAAALWFTRTVTDPARYSRALDTLVWAVIGALVASVILDATSPSRGSLSFLVLMAAMSLLIVVVLIGLVWTRGEDPHVRVIALGFVPVLVMAIFPIARTFNLIPVSPLTRFGVTIGAAIEMPILFYALSLRGTRRREAQVRASALAHNDTLTGLARERTLLQRLAAALERCAALGHACVLMGVRIANYESIVAEYGRDTAERVLVISASLLRNVIGDVDMAARVGDHAFALLVEGPATPADATSRAQQLVASGLRHSDALPAGLTIKFLVAVALLPDKELDATGSLKWVVDAVNAVPADARKLIRPLNF